MVRSTFRGVAQLGVGALVSLACWFGTSTVAGGILTWDPAGAVPATGGAGVWDTDPDHKRWLDGANALQAWFNNNPPDDAVFPPMNVATATVTVQPVTAGNLTFNGDGYTVGNGNPNAITLAAAGGISRANVTGTNTATIAAPLTANSLMKTGTGTLILSGTNTIANGVSITEGTLQSSTATPFANGATISPVKDSLLQLGELTLTGSVKVQPGNATATISALDLRSPIISGDVALGMSAALKTEGPNAQLALTGRITGDGGLTVDGTGKTFITPANGVLAHTYAGGTTVKGGTLYIKSNPAGGSVTGSGDVVVMGGATLQSSDANSPGKLTVEANGTLSLRDNDNLDGVTLSTGPATLKPMSTFVVPAYGDPANGRALDSNSQLSVTGDATITDSNLSLKLFLYTPKIDDQFFILVHPDGNGTTIGTFAGLPKEGSTFTATAVNVPYTFAIYYLGDAAKGTPTGGHDVMLKVVPEPSTFVLCALGTIGWLFDRSRKARSILKISNLKSNFRLAA